MNNQPKNICIVIVLYKQDLSNCISYNSFMESFENNYFTYSLLIYNNSSNIYIENSEDYHVVNAETNSQLVTAYNFSLDFAIKNNIKWLLLVDQDTKITKEYLQKLSIFIKDNNYPEIAAVAPFLKDKDEILSPKIISNYIWREYPVKEFDVSGKRVVAFNSLSLIRVSFLNSIGGFSKKYSLDMVDHWFYNQVFLKKQKVFILDCAIEHQLSFQNYEKNIDINRHIAFLSAENNFLKSLTLLHFISYKIKLFLRAIKQLILFSNKKYAVETFKYILKF